MMADETIKIGDSRSLVDQRDRLRFDARRWYLSKLAPKRYGDKMAIEQSGNVGISQLLDAVEQARTPPVEDAN
jgi:Bacteriophage Sf6, terminase small subunit-like